MGRVMRRREAMRAVVRACGFTAQPLLRIAGVRGLCREFHHVRIGGGSAAKHVRAAARKGHPNLRRICPRMCPLRRACGAGVLQRRTQAVRDGFFTPESARFRAERARMRNPSRRSPLFAPPRGARFLKKRAFTETGRPISPRCAGRPAHGQAPVSFAPASRRGRDSRSPRL